ncbi:MAG: hypothetical protein P4N60_19805 [Verrucomicrobiae bacterium]|nr:hypothetical protein [Verrucomicrobiae bacterium]
MDDKKFPAKENQILLTFQALLKPLLAITHPTRGLRPSFSGKTSDLRLPRTNRFGFPCPFWPGF